MVHFEINQKEPNQVHQSLLMSCMQQVTETYFAGIEEGINDPVVLLCDCENELGYEFASMFCEEVLGEGRGKTKTELEIEARKGGSRPGSTVTWSQVVPLARLIEWTSEFTRMPSPEPNRISLIVVAENSMSHLSVGISIKE